MPCSYRVLSDMACVLEGLLHQRGKSLRLLDAWKMPGTCDDLETRTRD